MVDLDSACAAASFSPPPLLAELALLACASQRGLYLHVTAVNGEAWRGLVSAHEGGS